MNKDLNSKGNLTPAMKQQSQIGNLIIQFMNNLSQIVEIYESDNDDQVYVDSVINLFEVIQENIDKVTQSFTIEKLEKLVEMSDFVKIMKHKKEHKKLFNEHEYIQEFAILDERITIKSKQL